MSKPMKRALSVASVPVDEDLLRAGLFELRHKEVRHDSLAAAGVADDQRMSRSCT